MAVLQARVSLQAWTEGKCSIHDSDFFGQLAFSENEQSLKRLHSSSACHLVFFDAELGSDLHRRSENFFEALQGSLEHLGRWLLIQSAEAFRSFEKKGLKVQVLIDLKIDQDQMELALPPVFLKGCGAHNLKVYAITND